jgi:hypothetical protein
LERIFFVAHSRKKHTIKQAPGLHPAGSQSGIEEINFGAKSI